MLHMLMEDGMHYISFGVAAKKLSMTFRQNLKINFKVMSLSQKSKASLGTVASCGHERWSSKWVAALNTQESNLSSCSSWEGYRNSAGNKTTLGCKNQSKVTCPTIWSIITFVHNFGIVNNPFFAGTPLRALHHFPKWCLDQTVQTAAFTDLGP